MWIHGRERVAGIIGRKAIHLQEEDDRKKKPELKDLWIDIGATSRAEVEAVIQLGDVATFQYEFQLLLGDRATARGFDNKMGARPRSTCSGIGSADARRPAGSRVGSAIGSKFIRHNHPRHITQALQQLAEEALGRLFVAAALHQNV